MNLQTLFPIAIGTFELERDFFSSELDYIYTLDRMQNIGNSKSSVSNVLHTPQLANLRYFLQQSLDEYFHAIYAPKNKVGLYITQSWVNYTGKDQFHHMHSHSNSFVSGVLYIKANKTKDKIHFQNTNKPLLTFPSDNYNMFNSDSWWLPVGSRELVLFPSSLQHMVQKLEDDEERISLSFNTFVRGEIGDEDKLTQLILE